MVQVTDPTAMPSGLPAEPPKNVSAAPAVYIEVVINDRKTVYDVATAKYVRDELDAALAALTPPPAPSQDGEANPPETP